MTGIELLTKVHELDPAAKRALLTGWGDLEVGDRLVRAAVLGQVDDWGLKPWRPGDEGFHQLVVGLLYEWAQLYRPGFQVVQVVGEQWSAHAHELRERPLESGPEAPDRSQATVLTYVRCYFTRFLPWTTTELRSRRPGFACRRVARCLRSDSRW